MSPKQLPLHSTLYEKHKPLYTVSMKQAHKNRATSKPKHKHTKEYLKHYYPFLPVLASIGILIIAIFAPVSGLDNSDVLGAKETGQQSQLLDATNQARTERNVSPLQTDKQLSEAARAKAKDMVTRDYWSHTSPEGQDPWDFITNAGYSYQTAGENLAFGFTNDTAIVNAWLNSSSHRENVLNPSFTEVGFGTATSSNFTDNGPVKIVVAMYAAPANSSVSSSNTENILGAQRYVPYIEGATGIQWSSTIVTLLIGGLIVFLLTSHTLALNKVVTKTERFVTRHPLFDSALLLILAAGVFLIRTTGVIL